MAADKELAIKLAKDVIAHIEILNLTDNSYIFGKIPLKDMMAESVEMADMVSKDCQVCALGALILSKMRVLPFPVSEVLDLYPRPDIEKAQVTTVRPSCAKKLTDAFTPADLELIETAFERNYAFAARGEYECKNARAAERFGERYENDRERLAAIMQNVIDHNGRFVPPALTTYRS